MTQPAAETFPADTSPPGMYTLDPERTTVRADVKAMFGLFTVHGTFRLKSGQVSIAAEPGGSSVRAIIDAGSYVSGNAPSSRLSGMPPGGGAGGPSSPLRPARPPGQTRHSCSRTER